MKIVVSLSILRTSDLQWSGGSRLFVIQRFGDFQNFKKATNVIDNVICG